MRVGAFLRVGLQRLGDILGKILFVLGLRLFFPGQLRHAGKILLRRRRENPGVVPIDRAAELRERHAVNFRARFEVKLLGVHFQPHPFAGFGQRAHQQFLRSALVAVGNRVLVAPVGAVQPLARVVLEHDRLGQIRWIKINVSEQLVVLPHDQRLGGLREEILGQSFVGARDRPLATMNFFAFHENDHILIHRSRLSPVRD